MHAPMPRLTLPPDLFAEARRVVEAGVAHRPPSLAVDDATAEAVRAALDAAEEHEGATEVSLPAPLLEAFKGLYIAGGEAGAKLEDASWHAILAAIQAAEGMRRPGVA